MLVVFAKARSAALCSQPLLLTAPLLADPLACELLLPGLLEAAVWPGVCVSEVVLLLLEGAA